MPAFDLYSDVFNGIKDLESVFPLPVPRATLDVGVFDAATGEFRYSAAVRPPLWEPGDPWREPGSPHGPTKSERAAHAEVDAIRVTLLFSVENASGPWTVSVNGHGGVPGKRAGTQTISIGGASNARFALSAGHHRYACDLIISRPPIIGLGAFTIPVLPIGIVYEPPQDADRRNYATLTVGTTIGSTVGLTEIHAETVSKPMPSEFADLMTFKGLLEGAGKALGAVGGIAGYIGKGVELLSKGLGSASATQELGTGTTSDKRLKLAYRVAEDFGTTEHQGPGRGDIILYLRNARLIWLYHAENFKLALLGYQDNAIAAVTAQYLKDALAEDQTSSAGASSVGQESSRSSEQMVREPRVLARPPGKTARGFKHVSLAPNREQIETLLAIDPFATDPTRLPEGDRFHYERALSSGGAMARGLTVEHERTDLDCTARMSLQTMITDQSKAFLSFLGIGPEETQKLTVSAEFRSSLEMSEQNSMSTSVWLFNRPGEEYSMHVYYDRVFGTFALVPAVFGPVP